LNWSGAEMKEAEGLGFILSQPITHLPRLHIVLRTFTAALRFFRFYHCPDSSRHITHTIGIEIAINLR